MRRLESKGYARTWLDGRTRVYAPAVKPATVIRETVDDLVERLFGGETLPLVQHLTAMLEITDLVNDRKASLQQFLLVSLQPEVEFEEEKRVGR